MKKVNILILAILTLINYSLTAQVAINTDGSSADGSAMLEVKSTTKGFLPPRMSEVERNSISSPATGLVVWCTNCGTDGELQVFNGTTWTNLIGGAASINAPSIGDSYQGGILAYIFQSGDPGYVEGETHGLIAAASDQSAAAEWGCYGTLISGADGTALGTGNQNTIDIEAGCATPGTAADICANLSLNGYADWYLPSKDELYKLYELKLLGFGNFIAYLYWSSTEGNNTATHAWPFNFDSGQWHYQFKSDDYYRVRAVRTF